MVQTVLSLISMKKTRSGSFSSDIVEGNNAFTQGSVLHRVQVTILDAV